VSSFKIIQLSLIRNKRLINNMEDKGVQGDCGEGSSTKESTKGKKVVEEQEVGSQTSVPVNGTAGDGAPPEGKAASRK